MRVVEILRVLDVARGPVKACWVCAFNALAIWAAIVSSLRFSRFFLRSRARIAFVYLSCSF
jgi:hypothetical protein